MNLIKNFFANTFINKKDKMYEKAVAELFNVISNGLMLPGWSSEKAFKEAFQRSVWIYACIERRAKDMIIPDFVIKNKNDEIVDKHQLLELLNNPCPELMPASHFWYRLYQQRDLAGNAYVLKARGIRMKAGKIIGFTSIFPDKIFAEVYEGRLLGYRAGQDLIPASEIIHFKHVSPNNFYVGHSPVQTLGTQVDILNEQDRFNYSNFRTGFIPNFILKMKDNTSSSHIEMIAAKMREKLATTNDKGLRQFMIINDLEDVIKLSGIDNGNDLMSTTRKEIKEEICAGFGIPLDLLGQASTSTYNNMQEKTKEYWRSTIIPEIQDICETLTHGLANEKLLQEGEYVWYDVSKVQALQQDLILKNEIVQKHYLMGVPFDVLNERFGLGYTKEQISRIVQIAEAKNGANGEAVPF